MDSNVHLSPAEKDLLCNAEIILTKNAIIRKAIGLLEILQEAMVAAKDDTELFSVSPKISKGENYMGLPYVILDYPRKSESKDLFFVRTMIWWGNFYSSTLHISGKYKHGLVEKIADGYPHLAERDYHIGTNPDPWIHHFEQDNYTRIAGISKSEFDWRLTEHDHIKIAAKWPVAEWDAAADNLWSSWKFLLGLVS